MLRIFKSYHLQALAEAHLERLNQQPASNPLLPQYYVVQNHGMARWLSLYATDREGISANKQFKFPAELYWQLMRAFKPDIPDILPSDRQPMTWSIFHILQGDEDQELAILQNYIGGGDHAKKERRCWNLARRIGDVFDQYLTYRPDMLMAWEKEKSLTNDDSEQWQMALWNKLRARWQVKESTSSPHRARLHRQLCKALDKSSLSIEKLPREITIFGVSEMPPAYLQVFLKCSKSIDVNFYRVEAAQNVANPLVKSLGKTGRDFEKLIREMTAEDGAISEEQINIESSTRTEASSTLFNALRQDLLTDEGGNKKVEPDHSVRIQACHSPRREVEVLYDQLLYMLDENESLDPSDIHVLCPQMDAYGSHIQSIFGASEPGIPHIPFHLSENPAASNPVFVSFLKLLNLLDSRFKVTEVLDLIDASVIKESHGFSEEDVETFQRWINKVGIRWGINGKQKKDFDLPPTNRFTWASGLHQMFAGYAMENEKDALFNGLYPFQGIQDSGQADLLGKLANFLHQLFKCHRQTKESRSPEDWGKMLQGWVDEFFPEGEEYSASVSVLRTLVNNFVQQARRSAFEDAVSFRLIRSHLQQLIERSRTGGGRPGQGVTFSGMIAMRNIPANVICLIGMNDGSFPQSHSDVSFDLIKKQPQKGDRRPNQDDRQLFLEAITTARDQLYISYVGQSNKKEVDFPPSVIVRELLDYMADQYDIAPDKLVHKHKLHAFSPAYFKQDQHKFFSYSELNLKVAQKLYQSVTENPPFIQGVLPKPESGDEALNLEDLIAFYQHPAKYFLQRRLGVYVYEDDLPDEDREGFELNPLQKYTISQELFDRFSKDRSVEDYEQISYAKNELPEGWPGKQFFKAESTRAEAFGKVISGAQKNAPESPVRIDYTLDETQIKGQLDNLYPAYQLLYRMGRGRAKDFIDFWIRHLMFQLVKAEEHPGLSIFYTMDKDDNMYCYNLSPVAEAENILTQLMKEYQKGQQTKTLFFADTSYAFAEKRLKKEKSAEESLEAAQKKWDNPDSDYPGEGRDPYNRRMLCKMSPLEGEELKKPFMEKATSFWKPYFDHLKKRKVN